MLSANEKITLRQLQGLIILQSLSVGIITLPRRAAMLGGWPAVIPLTLAACVSAALVSAAAGKFPNDSFYTYTRKVLSPPVAYILGMGLLARLLAGAGCELRLFALITREVLLKKTPSPVVCAVIAAAAVYAAVKGIEARARVGEILLFAVLLPVLMLLALALFDIDWEGLRPVFTVPGSLFQRIHAGSAFAATGLESILLVFPFLSQPKHGGRAVTKAVLFAGILLTLLTAVAAARFGAGAVEGQRWPVLRLLSTTNIPGAFIERQDALIMSIWIITSFFSIASPVFFGAVLMKDLFGRKKESSDDAGGKHARYTGHAVHDTGAGKDYPLGHWQETQYAVSSVPAVICGAIVLLLACIPLDADGVQIWADRQFLSLGLFYMFFFPVLLLAVKYLRGIKTDSCGG